MAPSEAGRLDRALEHVSDLTTLQLYRTIYLGAAAASLVLVCGILSIGAGDLALRIAIVACSVSLPLWVVAAGMIEYYLVLGPRSLAHAGEPFPSRVRSLLAFCAGAALLLAVAAVLGHVYRPALWAFLAAVGVGFAAASAFHWHLARWYGRDDA
ncbi:MAG: hypothetical protein ACJ8GK_03700 [Luteimonas sp.]